MANYSFVAAGTGKEGHFNFDGLPLTPAYSFRLDQSGTVSTAWREGTDISSQLLRQGLDLSATTDKYRVIDNTKFDRSATYPPHFVVPAGVSDQELELCMSFRSKKRVPALTYYHKQNGTSIWRCAQPLSGVRNRIENGDVRMLAEIGQLSGSNTHVTVFDARPYASASANRVRGGGFEDERYYPNMSIKFCGIHNIHVVRNCHTDLEDLSASPQLFQSIDDYGPAVERTNYMLILADILRGANSIVHCLLKEGSNAVVRCSDGWDRTSQLCALSEILLYPHYRTIRGFIELVEKDWLSFGHKFSERSGVYNQKSNDSEKSPIFLQFLACVYQMLTQLPDEFEFSQDLLCFIGKELYTGKYGTFLCDQEKQRAELGVRENTESIWTVILSNQQ